MALTTELVIDESSLTLHQYLLPVLISKIVRGILLPARVLSVGSDWLSPFGRRYQEFGYEHGRNHEPKRRCGQNHHRSAFRVVAGREGKGESRSTRSG